MTFSMISSRDTESSISYSLSFTVSFGPPSKLWCSRNGTVFLENIREPHPQITREVIRSRYINSTHPDMTHVTIRPSPQSREVALYRCFVSVESRINIDHGDYDHDKKSTKSSTVTVTGECLLNKINYT